MVMVIKKFSFGIYFLMGFFLMGFNGVLESEPPLKMNGETPKILEIGYSVPVSRIRLDKMEKAYQAGIRHVEASGMNIFFDKNGDFVKPEEEVEADRKSTRLNSSHVAISYAVFCL